MARSTSRTDPTRSRRARPPLWLVEGLDIVRLRKGVFGLVVGVVVAAGTVMAIVLPAIVPPVPVVGVAVAVAAILLGLAVAISLDAADVTIRGPRHVAAAGAELVAILPEHSDVTDAQELATAVLDARAEEDRKLLLGLASCGPDVRAAVEWTDTLGLAIARRGASVLRVDLASGRTPRPGLYEVHRGECRLNEVVDFEPDLRLARTGAGSDQAGALTTLPALHERLPRDLDVLLVAMPAAASRPVVTAARSLDHVLLVVERDGTSRVELIAALDAMESAGAHAQVVLLDTPTAAVYRRIAAPVADPAVAERAPAADEALDEAGEEPRDGTAEDAGLDEAPEQPPSEVPDDVTVTEVDESVSSAEVEPGDGIVSSYASLHDDDLVGAFDPYVPDALDDDATPGPPPVAQAPDPGPDGTTGPSTDDPGAPGQDPGRSEAAGTHDEPGALEPRDLDVMLGAAAASAQVEVEAGPPDADDLPIVEDGDEDHVVPGPPEDDDPTDELPRQARPSPLRGPDREDDEIRTTAYLVDLMRDIEARGRRS